jgi:hypothetical protein
VLGIGGLALVVVNTKTAPHGCAQAEQAAVRADDLITGFRQQTVTSADAASAFARISRDLDDVASIADDAALATHARSASASAARLRVMLVEGTGDITGDYDEFVADLRAIVAICKAA